MSGKPTIAREHVSFAVAGLIFGFLLGFVVAHQVYGGRQGGVMAANAPETMGGQRGAPVMAQQPGTATAPPGGGQADAGMAGMQVIQQEINALKQAIEANPKDAVALTRLGNIYMDAAMWDKAVGYYSSALEVQPENVDVRTDMGACLRQLGRVPEALKAFHESVQRDARHWKGWFNIGIVNLYDLGEFEKAEQAFAKSLELNPGAFDMNAVRAEIEKLKQEKAARPAGSAPS